jgi:hypothetical protein
MLYAAPAVTRQDIHRKRMTRSGPSGICSCSRLVMSEESFQNSETKEIVWDPVYTGELDAQMEKRSGSSVNPTSIALLLGTGVLLLFCQAFLRRLTERFGEDSANYVADRIRDLGGRIDELRLNRNFLSDRPKNGMRNLLSRVTMGDRRLVPHHGAPRTVKQAAASDPLAYRIVVISISHLAGRRKF